MLIGFIGSYYHKWIPSYEDRIGRWRDYLKKSPGPGEATKEEEEEQLLRSQWIGKDDNLLDELKKAIPTNPVLKRPIPNRRFYLKTDWSANAQDAALLQVGYSEDEVALTRDLEGGECEFEKSMTGLRLLSIAFISQRWPLPSSRHSLSGEASTGRWAMLKFKSYLEIRKFTWITD